jgi:predicted TIM-barrel fold metal-dependent hydrolase
MIVDADCHISPLKEGVNITAHELLRRRGGVGSPDLSKAMIEMAQDYPNLHLIGSMVHHTSILDAIKTLGASRVAFGSDTPFALMHVCVAEYNALLDGEVTAQEKAQVMGGNLLRLLALPGSS